MNYTNWNPRRKPIVVGMLLEEQEETFVQAAWDLARKLESPLELVHATQPIFNYMGAGDVVVNPYYGYDRVIYDMEEQEAREKLAKVQASIPSGIQVGLHVLRDYSFEALTTIAAEVHAGLIVCGIKKEAKSNFFAGMSTAFSLASHSDIPVLIVPLGSRINFTTRPRVLVADNLAIEGRRALEAAIQLADDLDCTEFCHSHVHKLGVMEVDNMVEKVREAMNLGRIPANPEFSSKNYVEQIQQKIASDLSYRFHNSQGAANLKSRYFNSVNFGKPSEELHKLAVQRHSQLIVFGRHHLFHKQGFAFGKIPYEAMVDEDIATLIVPDVDPALVSAHKT